MSNPFTELSYNLRFVLTLTLKPGALMSCIASTLVAIHIFRDKEKMKKMYHRLALGMCISSACNAINIFLTSWAIPYDYEGYIHPCGTVDTCTASGFISQLGFVVQYYYVSLSIYVFMALRCEFRIKEIECIEKYLHLGVFIFPLLSAIYLSSKELFNPIGIGCWINSYPQGCKSDKYGPCKRGPIDPTIYNLVFVALPTIINVIVATLMIIGCYVNERIKNKRLLKSGRLKGKKAILEHARRQKSMLIARQGATYLVPFYISSSFLIIGALLQNAHPSFFPIMFIATLLFPMDGLFFTLAYMILLREKQDDPFPKVNHQNSTIDICNEDRQRHRRSFSIFDGTDEEKWKQFGVYVGSDNDNDDDSDEKL